MLTERLVFSLNLKAEVTADFSKSARYKVKEDVMRLWLTAGALVVALVAGCTLMRSHPSLPNGKTIVRDQLVIHSDFALPQQHRLLDELVLLRTDVYGKLDLPSSDEPIDVFLFDHADKYRRFLKAQFPELPDRRAFFVESDTRLTVYAHWGDLVAEDLRHEVTHGYLHAVVPALPLWLDEGLAEYFECPRGHHGLHTAHAQTLQDFSRRSFLRLDLVRLEQLTSLDQMTLRDYSECWLWVHHLLNSDPEHLHLLRTYLANLRREGVARPLSDSLTMLDGDSEQRVLAHLQSLPP